MVILNGDIIDIWQFSKRYWPESHMKIIRHFTGLVSQGIPVYYLTGNHDEMLRKFTDFELGSLKLLNKIVLTIDNKKAWFFHGDVFDITMQHSKWLARLGAIGYDTLILLNSMVNWGLTKMGRQKMSFSKRVKSTFKNAVKFINQFENTAAALAVEKGYHYVVCGHIHQPEIREIQMEAGKIIYLNSGDWVESLTALEYQDKSWCIYKYSPERSISSDFDQENEGTLKDKLDISILLTILKSDS